MKRVAIVGAGFIAEKHAEGMKQFDNVRLVGVADVVADKREKMAAKYGATPYASFGELLEDDGVDIVDICVPSHLHLPFSLRAIQSGKPFMLEKPIAMNAADARAIVGAAAEAGVEMMVGQSLRFKAEYARAKQLIESGRIGRTKQVYAARLGQRPSWGEWYSDPKKSGGVLYNIMLHDIDYLFSVFGEVESVYAVGTACDEGGYEDIMATLSFTSGVKAVVDGSAMMTPGFPFTMMLRVDGTEGTVGYSFIGGENTELCRMSELTLYRHGEKPELVACPSYSNHGKEISYFASCVEKGEQPMLCLPEESVYVMEILEGVMESLEEGKIVYPPAAPAKGETHHG